MVVLGNLHRLTARYLAGVSHDGGRALRVLRSPRVKVRDASRHALLGPGAVTLTLRHRSRLELWVVILASFSLQGTARYPPPVWERDPRHIGI